MHLTGLRLLLCSIGHELGLVSEQEVEAARLAHKRAFAPPPPQDCDHYVEVHTEGRGIIRECVRHPNYSAPRGGDWR